MATLIIELVIGKICEAFVGKLGEMAVEQVANQATLLLNFKKDFEWLKKEFIKVRGYLQHEHYQNEHVKKWLADVRDIGLDAEDLLEECVVQPLYRDSFISRYKMGRRIFRYKIGRRIRKLKNRMESIMKDAADLHLVQQVCQVSQHSISHGGVEELKKSGHAERDARPVAIHAKVRQILHMLEDDALQVIALVGMGGIGKTFLLQNVYNHHKVRQRFQKTIWLSISQDYSFAMLQRDIASHLNLKKDVKAGEVSERRAAELIHEKLLDKSSLIVLDDVWRVEGVSNLIQRLGIPCGINNHCKVVVTTRSMEVCNIIGASKIYHMELLSEKESWDLFRNYAFSDDQHDRPSKELDEVAHQVERECGRLPLAVRTVAASMASKKLLSSWEAKLRQLKEVSDLPDPVGPILRLSYYALPAELKPCFLYFSFFGEDVEIDAEYLIYLWIGEGFIPEGKEQWNTGCSYLEQLRNLCLVEPEVSEGTGVSKNGWSRYGEFKKTCKIHDLMLDLIRYICKENKCALTVEEASTIGCRHILLANKGLDHAAISQLKCPSSLRTLSLSQNIITELPTKLLKGVRALRVIDLSDTHISLLPRFSGNFKLLRVLNLSNTRVTKVPDCVRNLKSLCYLNVSTCPLPKWIGDLKCLQHLHVDRVDYSPEISRGISKLVFLRTLRSEYPANLVLKDVAELTHLQELNIGIDNEEEQRSLEDGVLQQLVNMHHLTISYTRDPNLPTFPEKMKAMKDLEHFQYLSLYRFIVPSWMVEFGNLRVLKLRSCDLSRFPAFEKMPNLMKLELEQLEVQRSSPCVELPESFGKRGAFPLLRCLVIRSSFLEKLPDLQRGAMPRVEVFVVMDGRKLQKIPKGFDLLRNLKLLDLSDTNLSYPQRARLKEGGEYWNKIKASNPDVTIRM